MLLAYGILLLLLVLPALWELRSGRESLPLLANFPAPDEGLPRLSVIIPARNEEGSVRQAVESILRQDYPNLEIILINDRSTDRTGEIVSELAAQYPGRLNAVHIQELPPGWLGKNHALWLGARKATGEWLLFTDADILFHPTCFRRAVGLAQSRGVGHLVMLVDMLWRSYGYGAFLSVFAFFFVVGLKPHRLEDPKWKRGLGVGAFNLVNRRAYESVGTFEKLSLRPDEDVRLGMRLRAGGVRQMCALGKGMAEVEWYPSLGAVVSGLEKNGFATVDYSVLKAVGSFLALMGFNVLPFGLVWLAEGTARWVLGAAVVLLLALVLQSNRAVRASASWRFLPAFPFMAAFFAFTIMRASWLTLRRGGISWRDTFYPLSLLRTQTGLEGVDHPS